MATTNFIKMSLILVIVDQTDNKLVESTDIHFARLGPLPISTTHETASRCHGLHLFLLQLLLLLFLHKNTVRNFTPSRLQHRKCSLSTRTLEFSLSLFLLNTEDNLGVSSQRLREERWEGVNWTWPNLDSLNRISIVISIRATIPHLSV